MVTITPNPGKQETGLRFIALFSLGLLTAAAPTVSTAEPVLELDQRERPKRRDDTGP